MSELIEALGKAHERVCLDKLYRKACYLSDICKALNMREIGDLIAEAMNRDLHMNQMIYIALIEGRIDENKWAPILHYLSEEDNDALESVIRDQSRKDYLDRFHKKILIEHLEGCLRLEV